MQKRLLPLILGLAIMITLFLAGPGGTVAEAAPNQKLRAGAGLTSVDDLADKRIGVLLGSTHDTYAHKTWPKATIMQYRSPSDLIVAVKTEKVDAAFFSHESLPDVFDSDQNFAIFAEKLFGDPIGMGFNKGNDALREQFNTFLRQIKNNGVYDDMIRRWMENRATAMPVIENSANNGRLVVGIVSDKGMPFTIVKDGKMVGFDVELALRFGAYLGQEVKFMDMEFSGLIAAAVSNKIDMICSTLMITEERKKQIDFSDPYDQLSASIFALKKNIAAAGTGKLAIMDDLADKRVGVYAGTIHDAFIAEKYPRAKILRYDSVADMVISAKINKIDAFLVDATSGNVLLKNNPELGLLTDDVLTKPLGVGFSRKNSQLRENFNDFLQKARADGTYDQIYQRWCANDPEQAVMPEFKENPAGDRVVLGVAVADLPYVAVVNGEYVGFDVEIIKTFAQREGLQLKIMTMEFQSLVAALASGKVDMIADGIAITEERSKQIDFSDSYLDFKTAVIALKKNLAINDGGAQEVTPSETVTLWQGLSHSFYSNIIAEKRYLLIIDGLKVTVLISILATLWGTLLGAIICFMRMSRHQALNMMARVYISVMRGIPVLVLLMLLFYVAFAAINISPVLVAVIAFGMNFGAYVSEMFRSAIEGIDPGQKEAGIASGFTTVQTFIYIILPQAVRRLLPVYKGEFISLVKMTSVVGYIAVQDLTKASDIIRSRTFDAFFPLVMVAVLYFIVAWLLALALDYVDFKTDPQNRRSTGGAGV